MVVHGCVAGSTSQGAHVKQESTIGTPCEALASPVIKRTEHALGELNQTNPTADHAIIANTIEQAIRSENGFHASVSPQLATLFKLDRVDLSVGWRDRNRPRHSTLTPESKPILEIAFHSKRPTRRTTVLRITSIKDDKGAPKVDNWVLLTVDQWNGANRTVDVHSCSNRHAGGTFGFNTEENTFPDMVHSLLSAREITAHRVENELAKAIIGLVTLQRIILWKNHTKVLEGNELDDEGVDAIVQHMPQLTKLVLNRTRVTDLGGIKIGVHLKRLTELYLVQTLVGNQALGALAHGLPHLETLNMKGTQITDQETPGKEIPNLEDSFPNLKEIVVNDTQAGDNIARAFTHVTTLEKVSFHDTPLTDTGAITLLQGLPNLREATFTGTSVGVATAASISDATHLKKITLPRNNFTFDQRVSLRATHADIVAFAE